MRKAISIVLALIFSQSIAAIQIAKVNIPEQVAVASQNLHLQGAAIRSKFFLDVYIGAFYSETAAKTPKNAMDMPGAKRMSFYFLRNVSQNKLKSAWKEGFQENNPTSVLSQNKNLIAQFLDLFDKDIGKGDIMTIDFIPDKGTVVSIDGKTKGTITQEHFYTLVLSVWMGEHPPSQQFRKALLNLN
jgi:hypothetical protein